MAAPTNLLSLAFSQIDLSVIFDSTMFELAIA